MRELQRGHVCVFDSSYILLSEENGYLERVTILAAMSVDSFELSAVPGTVSTPCIRREAFRGIRVVDSANEASGDGKLPLICESTRTFSSRVVSPLNGISTPLALSECSSRSVVDIWMEDVQQTMTHHRQTHFNG